MSNKDEILERTLITGASGSVGSYIDFGIKTDKRSLDVSDLKEALSVGKKYNPKVILHLAAETDMDRCERDPAWAYEVNAIGTYNMTVVAREIGAKLVYISTAGVFDGDKETPYSEGDMPNPRNYYGHSKYLGELAVRENSEDFLIVRVCWMMGGGPRKDRKFVAKIVEQLEQGKRRINAVTDQIGTPTYGKDLVNALKVLIEEGEKGILHMPNKGFCSRFDVAKLIVEVLNASAEVVPVDSSFFNLDALRTKNEMLASKMDIMRPWQDALREYITTEWELYFYEP